MTRTSGSSTFKRAKLVAAAILLSFLAASAASADDLTATISTVAGKVEIQTAQGWVPARPGLVLAAGTTISTGFRSEAVLQVGPSVVTVKALSRLTLQELAEKEGLLSTKLALKVGAMKADVRPAAVGQQQFTVQSPISTASVRGTGFDFDGETLTVEHGLVELADSLGGSVLVPQGEGAQVDPTGTTSPKDFQAILISNSTTNTNPNSTFLPPSGFSPPTSVTGVTNGVTPTFDDVTDDIIIEQEQPVIIIINTL